MPEITQVGGNSNTADETSLTLTGTTLSILDGGVSAAKMGVLTTKGDLMGYSTLHTRLAVGTDTYGLIADSSTGTGLAWTSATDGNKGSGREAVTGALATVTNGGISFAAGELAIGDCIVVKIHLSEHSTDETVRVQLVGNSTLNSATKTLGGSAGAGFCIFEIWNDRATAANARIKEHNCDTNGTWADITEATGVVGSTTFMTEAFTLNVQASGDADCYWRVERKRA